MLKRGGLRNANIPDRITAMERLQNLLVDLFPQEIRDDYEIGTGGYLVHIIIFMLRNAYLNDAKACIQRHHNSIRNNALLVLPGVVGAQSKVPCKRASCAHAACRT